MTTEELMNIADYEGCRNCENQIEPLRMCEWAESGGDGKIHIICPYWKMRGGADMRKGEEGEQKAEEE